jgi:ferritin-like metal-binding protein YciE
MKITSFKDMYIAELQELANMEEQLATMLPHMAKKAAHPALKEAFARHAEETVAHQQRLASVLQKHGASPRAHTDQAMQALVKETDKILIMVKGNDLRDASLIASAQKLEHYEIAAYGTAVALAGQLDMREDQATLQNSLREEKHFDALLTRLAIGQVNPDALAA